MLRKVEFDSLFSSDPGQGATNVTENGSSFDIVFNDAMAIPPRADNIRLSVINATIWWTVPNVTPANNSVHVDFNGFEITAHVPTGLYNTTSLQAAIRTALISVGGMAGYINANFALTTDEATQKVTLVMGNASGTDEVFVGDAGSVFGILGWPVGSPNALATQIAPDIAFLNQVNYFLIHSSLAASGIRFNDAYNSTVARVLIDVDPGSQINYNPQNPAVCNPYELIGTIVSRARFWLTDQNNNPVDTFGETWSVMIRIYYEIPYDDSR